MWPAVLRIGFKPAKNRLAAGVLLVGMSLARSFLESVIFDQLGSLQSFLLFGIHDQRSLMSSLKGAPMLLERGGAFQTRHERTLIVSSEQKAALEKADLVESNGLQEGSGKEHGQKKDAG